MTPIAATSPAGQDSAVLPLSDPAEIDRRYRYWRVRVMYAMTTGYALYYFVQKNISMAAKPIT